ncbi:RNAse p and RNAse mrp subunit protein [Rutstroemia sp. NJR-2017a WRK4]|nr:RNAse p and RNAse mrp subunit protein [Rutstroemia sp. NJR-2017a WRK4]
MDKKTKTVFQLDTPFTAVQWPQVSIKDQDTIIELLCSVLTPIGNHRSNYVTRSKGKRSRKRKRQDSKVDGKPLDIPPPPEVSNFVLTGLNSISRLLEEHSKIALSRIEASPDDTSTQTQKNEDTQMCLDDGEMPTLKSQTYPSNHITAIFVARSNLPSILYSHLPQLITTASKAHPDKPPTKLVQLPRGVESRLALALGLQRVSFIGILDGAPHCKALVDLVRECVSDIEIPWLDEVQKAEYLEVKINSIETSVGTMKPKEKN